MTPTRPPSPPVTAAAALAQATRHADTVREVADAVGREAFVVVGMGWNPSVGRARRLLQSAGHSHTYLGYGNYITGWRKRLAIKLWSGWPTFPQVFINGALVGGFKDTEALAANGELDRLIAG